MLTMTREGRRAQRFASLLDGSAELFGDDQLGFVLEVTHTLERLPIAGEIDPNFRTRLRGRLLAEATVRPVGATPAPPRERTGARAARRLRVPRRAGVLGSVVIGLMAVCGVVAASTGAVPGSPLYGIKRATEAARLAVAGDDVARGRLYLSFARTRMGEARTVHDDRWQLLVALAGMDSATRHGSRLLTGVSVGEQDRAPLDAIDAFINRQRPDLLAVMPSLIDPRSDARATESLALLDRVHARAIALRSALSCATPGPSASDDLGPVPGACRPAAGLPPAGGDPGARRGGPERPVAVPGSSSRSAATGTGGPGSTPTEPAAGTAVPAVGETLPAAPAISPPNVGPAVTGVLGQVLGTLGVPPPAVPLPPVPPVPVPVLPPLPLPPLPPLPGTTVLPLPPPPLPGTG